MELAENRQVCSRLPLNKGVGLCLISVSFHVASVVEGNTGVQNTKL